MYWKIYANDLLDGSVVLPPRSRCGNNVVRPSARRDPLLDSFRLCGSMGKKNEGRDSATMDESSKYIISIDGLKYYN